MDSFLEEFDDFWWNLGEFIPADMQVKLDNKKAFEFVWKASRNHYLYGAANAIYSSKIGGCECIEDFVCPVCQLKDQLGGLVEILTETVPEQYRK